MDAIQKRIFMKTVCKYVLTSVAIQHVKHMKSLKLSATMTVMKMKSVIPTIVLIPYNLDSLFYTWIFIHVYKHRGKLMLVDLTAKD